MLQPRLRDGFTKREPYPLNQVPKLVVDEICRHFVFQLAMGNNKLSGNDWSRIFAEVIDGEDYSSPLGVADVGWEQCCWSQKTVQHQNPFEADLARLIVGRTSPTYSYGTTDVKANPQLSGNQVLSIYNQRIDQARSKHQDTRLGVLIRNMKKLEFTYFERTLTPFAVNDFEWRLNKNDNFEAYIGDEHRFTFQPHGSQLTIREAVPASATRFRLAQRPAIVDMRSILEQVGFSSEWVEIT